MRTAKFLSQTGAFAHMLARNNAEKKPLTSEQRDVIGELRQQATILSNSLKNLQNKVYSGNINWHNIASQGDDAAETGETPIRDGFTKVREELDQYPTLIYDGPFSDHIMETAYNNIKGRQLSSEEAEKIAVELVKQTSVEPADSLKKVTSRAVRGKLPCYSYQYRKDNNVGYTVDLTRAGGKLVTLMSYRDVGEKNIDLEQARDRALSYLAKAGFENMQSTYAEIIDNIAYIPFVYKKDNIIYYSDLINVQIALDNNEILGVEALGYLSAHKERKLPEPVLTKEQAREKGAVNLDQVDSVRLALIPIESTREVLTYEIRGTNQGNTYLIYLNAVTGTEEKILQVIESEKGTFTI